MAKKKLPIPKSWADLLKPECKGEIQVANPASSGTAYTMIATLVQLMGEDKAFEYLNGLHKNVSQYTRSGTDPIKALARGETAFFISFVNDAPGKRMQGLPLETVNPAEIGSMSIVKGARNQEAAKKFYDWALTPTAQELSVAAKQFQLPSNKSTKLDERMPDFKKIKFINYDYAKYGASTPPPCRGQPQRTTGGHRGGVAACVTAQLARPRKRYSEGVQPLTSRKRRLKLARL